VIWSLVRQGRCTVDKAIEVVMTAKGHPLPRTASAYELYEHDDLGRSNNIQGGGFGFSALDVVRL